jgi:nickel-dependent lactate racemase
MVALGTHRPMSQAELIGRLGRDVFESVQVINLPQQPGDFVDLGVTPLGIPIHVSRRYLESDISIAVGNIIPHMYAGWAGGAKMVQPGVTSAVTTGRTHVIAGPRVYETLGEVDNPVRKEMEEIALRSGLKFILNVVLNAGGEVVHVVAGDVIQAHRAGVEIARPIYTLDVKERADIVIASSHPADRDLWQGFKCVNNCGMLVKDGGTLILLIPATEGIAPDHQQLVEFGTTPGEQVLQLVKDGKVADEVAAATYVALDRTRRRVNVSLVTDGISNSEARKIGLTATRGLPDALDAALSRQGSSSRIGVVTAGADILARLPGISPEAAAPCGLRTAVLLDAQ